uniref:Beta/gamma crystallin 'Greek key' domain-containing protein n=1 Tax=Astyanax mexicanus TaxID=7994 RepID=A0A3B1K9M1_ASTMX
MFLSRDGVFRVMSVVFYFATHSILHLGQKSHVITALSFTCLLCFIHIFLSCLSFSNSVLNVTLPLRPDFRVYNLIVVLRLFCFCVQLRVYSKPGFAGESREFGTEVADCGGLIPMSFRVILGSWLLYDEKDYCGNQFVLGEGFYPDLTSCGCMTTAIKSLKPIPYSFSEPSISLFSLSSFEGLETVADSPMETMDNFFTQSLKVNSGLWVVYEFGQFRGCQMLLQMGEYPCWGEYSSWDTIGSLQPLRQRRTYMQVRNGALGMALTAERTSDPLSPAKLLLRPADRSLDTQHWIYSQALLKSKVGKGCLSVIGGKASVGARVALWEEHGRIHQRWRLNKNGTISPHLDFNLVLDRRGGSGIDKDHLILSELCTDKASQYWDIEVL